MTDPYRLTTASGTYANQSANQSGSTYANPAVDHYAETIGGPIPASQPRPAVEAHPAAEPLTVVTGSGIARVLLWVLLVISAIGNMVATYAALGTPAHLACGSVTALCLIALIVQRLRGRR
ncbi:hypothetical protein [Streptomyces ureilyticus]|uniref:Uncharacterized protein n=1 Tax=Streptomyces ureilyticus TaxID=1775131 RepID=A0ABX0EAB6_9ACTN|nr:hypothetical protein [Streptomyces ureilyticus]NGO48962.1 hypothetical protein [Streptomyces ureilyticus]